MVRELLAKHQPLVVVPRCITLSDKVWLIEIATHYFVLTC